MADPIIELQELLNRASGPGKIGPDKPLETRLYDANGQPIGTAGNPLQVKAQGSVQELTVVEGLALTDTSYTLRDIDVSMFRQWDFRVVSTLNQRVRLKLYAGSTDIFNTGFRYTYLNDNGEVSSKSLELTVPWTVAVQERSGSLGSQVPEVFHAPVNPITTLSLRILADTAPTSGSISIYIRGVKS